MCGILGFAGDITDRQLSNFEIALDTLQHRGPDDRGVYRESNLLLGHRRLSIIDLSSAGHQPMRDSVSGAIITFNGMIYNYVELRNELQMRGHYFQSKTDTEVVLKAVVEWGANALARFNGMWSFAVWFPATQMLFFARDRFGVKPFLYAKTGRQFVFASEAKAILSLQGGNVAIDLRTLHDFLTFGIRNSGGHSFFEGISLLPAGHWGEYRVSTDDLRINRFWDYPERQAVDDADDGRSRFEAIFDDAVQIRLRSDVPVGITLSGGLDSTSILASAMTGQSADDKAALSCFTSVYGESGEGEAKWAAAAARPYGIKPIEVLAPVEHWLDALKAVTWHMDGPSSAPAVYPLWCLMAEAKKRGVTVLLEGQGADEALGGYSQHAALSLLDQLRRCRRSPSLDCWYQFALGLRKLQQTFGSGAMLVFKEAFPALRRWNQRWFNAGSTMHPEIRAAADCNEPLLGAGAPPRGVDPVTYQLWRDHSMAILPSLLEYGDSISMAHGIEARQPFLDFRLVEWLFLQPAELKVRNGQTKWLVREYLRRHGQSTIADRRDKLGYVTPAEDWLLAEDGALVRELLLSPDSRIAEFCRPAQIRRLLWLTSRGARVMRKSLYRLFSAEIWLRGLSEFRKP